MRLRHTEYLATGKLAYGLAVPRIQFFCLHHLFPDEVAPFRRMLGKLHRHFDFIPWSAAIRMVLEGRRPDRPLACFSSDDGFASNVNLARELEAFGTTGMFFLNPATFELRDAAAISEFCRTKHESQPVSFLAPSDVEALCRAGHEIGNHTYSHVICSETPAAEMAWEIERGRDTLESRFGPVLHFAWPYGWAEYFSQTARQLVFEAGHVSCASSIRGVHLASEAVVPTEQLCVRRLSIRATDPIEHILFRTAHFALTPDPEANEFPTLQPGV